MPSAVWAPLTAFTATLVTVLWLVCGRYAALALDHPNQRSLHAFPKSRLGGLALHLGILLSWNVMGIALPIKAAYGFMILLAVFFIEDVNGVPVVWRLAAQLCAAGLLASLLPDYGFGLAAVAIAALAIAWMTNIYNFMDGSDGLAGGMAVFGFSFYGVAAALAGNIQFALANFCIAASAAAFLVFNFHTARIFLGDVGAVPLGYLVAAFGLMGWLENDWPLWFPCVVFSPFIVDASITLGRRALRLERVWEAHTDHYYQRLILMGWSHRKTALAEYALMLLCGILALYALKLTSLDRMIAAAVLAVLYLVLTTIIGRHWRVYKSRAPAAR